MPTIQFIKKDLETLVGKSLSLRLLEGYLPWVKGELKDYQAETDELRIELNDTHRPDLWCVEGIARQIRQKLQRKSWSPSFFSKSRKKSPYQILVKKGTQKIRPYIGACVVKGIRVTDLLLAQLIQTQEKIAELYGRKRQTLSIGLYRLEKIQFPITYTVVAPDEASFIPLNSDRSMTLAEMIKDHPKGQEYGHILKDAKYYPLLVDQQKQVLSFPPIINSRDLGEVQAGDRDLLIEVTGMDLRMVCLAINIWAANLFDRGGSIERVEIKYPQETPFGKNIVMPYPISKPLSVDLNEIEKALAEFLKPKEVLGLLRDFGHSVDLKGKKLVLTSPPYRDDLMHPVDVVEELAISRGYENFEPALPSDFTIGNLTPIEKYSDRIRTLLIGMGFQEMASSILCSFDEVITRMRGDEEEVIQVENVMSETYSVLRNSILPSLLKVEAASSDAFYPHHIFEVGEVVSIGEEKKDPITKLHLGALVAHSTSNFSEAHSHLEMLFYYLDCSYNLETIVHPSFLEGRVGRIVVNAREVGTLGEIHPEVLERWGILMPCSFFEVSLDTILENPRK